MPPSTISAFLSLKTHGYKISDTTEQRRNALLQAFQKLTIREKNLIIKDDIAKALRNLGRLNKNRKPHHAEIYHADAEWVEKGMIRDKKRGRDGGDDDDDDGGPKKPRRDQPEEEPEDMDIDWEQEPVDYEPKVPSESKYDDDNYDFENQRPRTPNREPIRQGSKRPRYEDDQDYFGFPSKRPRNDLDPIVPVEPLAVDEDMPNPPRGTKRPREFDEDLEENKRPRPKDPRGTKRPREFDEDLEENKRPRPNDPRSTKRPREFDEDLPVKRPRSNDPRGTKRPRDDQDFYGFPSKRHKPGEVEEEKDIEEILEENRQRGRTPVFSIEDDDEDMEQILARKRAERGNRGKPAFAIPIESLPDPSVPIEIDPYEEPSRKRSRDSADEEDDFDRRTKPRIDWTQPRVVPSGRNKRQRDPEPATQVPKRPRPSPVQQVEDPIPRRSKTGPIDVPEARLLLEIDPKWRPLTRQQVERNWRALSRRYHPDKTNGRSNEYYQSLVEARRVLLDHVISLGGRLNFYGFKTL